ncbi:MAG TPA: pyridine nucleotide-disulfide oxidoreductase, partial [Treponemataceae bacterium]|nr:pyridine nucleotide-disulfide oxidoreductase [Treponemataceae bacterium]
MHSYDCVIVGSGPAGLGAAFEILYRKPDAKILLLEREQVSSGGLRNDCKMNFTYPIGFPVEYWERKLAEHYLERVEAFLSPEILPQKNLATYQRR